MLSLTVIAKPVFLALGDCGAWIIDKNDMACAMVVAAIPEFEEVLSTPLSTVLENIKQDLSLQHLPEVPLDVDSLSKNQLETSHIAASDHYDRTVRSKNRQPEGNSTNQHESLDEQSLELIKHPSCHGLQNGKASSPAQSHKSDSRHRYTISSQTPNEHNLSTTQNQRLTNSQDNDASIIFHGSPSLRSSGGTKTENLRQGTFGRESTNISARSSSSRKHVTIEDADNHDQRFERKLRCLEALDKKRADQLDPDQPAASEDKTNEDHPEQHLFPNEEDQEKVPSHSERYRILERDTNAHVLTLVHSQKYEVVDLDTRMDSQETSEMSHSVNSALPDAITQVVSTTEGKVGTSIVSTKDASKSETGDMENDSETHRAKPQTSPELQYDNVDVQSDKTKPVSFSKLSYHLMLICDNIECVSEESFVQDACTSISTKGKKQTIEVIKCTKSAK